MSRFSRYDTDEERLPEGMTRVGYDADTETYTYRDETGRYYEGAPGATYGHLNYVGEGAGSGEDQPFVGGGSRPTQPWETEKRNWRQSWAPLLNFFVLVGLFLIGVIWMLYWSKGDSLAKVKCTEAEVEYTVGKGDTCWDISQSKGISLDDLMNSNIGLDCDRLDVGRVLCVPTGIGNGDGEQDA